MSPAPVSLVPYETLANALGANELAQALQARGVDVVRTGSFGLSWLEPMLVLDGIAYGPVADLDDLESVRLGPLDELSALASQRRLVFDRCGRRHPLDYDPSGFFSNCGASPERSSRR